MKLKTILYPLIAAIILASLTVFLFVDNPIIPDINSNEVKLKAQNPIYTYKVVKTYRLKPNQFVQGLTYHNSILYLSTGLWGHSTLQKINLASGKTLKQIRLAKQYFAEGITILNNKLYQLTYTANKGFIYNSKTLQRIGTFPIDGQGWGLTSDSKDLIMSNGTSTLTFLNPTTFQVTRRINVRNSWSHVSRLNELEYIHGKIFANIWKTNLIAIINPTTGHITGWIDLTGIDPNTQDLHNGSVANGIAYNKANNTYLVTGKRWHKIYAIKLLHK